MPTIKAVSSSQRRRPVSAAFSTVQAQSSQQASDDPKVASDQVVEEPNGQQASQCLGQEDADRVEAEEPGTGDLQPESYRWFVDRDEATGIIGGKKEIVPVVHHT